eukprot:TRINITY_DN8470_c0_g1_i1.p1 TRINITY_DN8470_c0_g1~~TRINITY_DN8470_c0_g1_i1.p1  ORF type:complete len:533 (-),score=130.03 TRINITY_DN8470_c0_g1_i1:3-1526(-)
MALSFWNKLAYASGACGVSIFERVRSYYTLPFLLDEVGMSGNMAAIILLVSRLWDAFNDPLIGDLSDHTQNKRWGRRRSWLLYSSIPLALSYVSIWFSPPVPLAWRIAYFWVAYFVFEAVCSASRIPHSAMMAELTTEYDEVTSLSQHRYVAATALGMGASSLQAWMMGWNDDDTVTYLASAVFWAGVSIPLQLLTVFFTAEVPRKTVTAPSATPLVSGAEGSPIERVSVHKQPRYSRSLMRDVAVDETQNPLVRTFLGLWRGGKEALSSRSFALLALCFVSSAALELVATNQAFYIKHVLDASPAIMAESLIIQTVARLLGIPMWASLSRVIGKKYALLIGLFLTAAVQASFFFLGEGDEDIFLMLTPVRGGLATSQVLLVYAMAADVVDEDELLYGKRREGLFFSFLLFLQKLFGSFAVALSSWVLGWVGYLSESVGSGSSEQDPIQPDNVILALRLLSSLVPAAVLLAGWLACVFFPITREVHADIRRKLDERHALEEGRPIIN